MLSESIAVDMGSSYTKLVYRTRTLADETRAALDPDNSLHVLAAGEEGRRILGAGAAYPVRGGVADIPLAALILRRFSLRLLKRRTLLGVSAVIAARGGVPEREREALVELGEEAGFRRVRLVSGLLAGAVGAGADVCSESALMVADIGRETFTAGVISNGGLLSERTERMGSVMFDKRIMDYLAREHGLLVSSRAAERLKKSLDKPMLSVSCRDCASGRAKTTELSSASLHRELSCCAERLCGAIVRTLDAAPAEAVGDLVDNGILLIGGGARQFGLAEALAERLGVPVRTADDPELAIAQGVSRLAEGSVLPGREVPSEPETYSFMCGRAPRRGSVSV